MYPLKISPDAAFEPDLNGNRFILPAIFAPTQVRKKAAPDDSQGSGSLGSA